MTQVYLPASRDSNFPKNEAQRMQDWHFGLCSCCGDCGICCFAYMCFGCLVSQNSADLDGNQNTCGCCYPGSVAKNRAQAAAQFAIQTNVVCECLTCAFLPFCSEVQVAREIKWHRENVRDAPQVQMMPSVVVMNSPGPGYGGQYAPSGYAPQYPQQGYVPPQTGGY